MNHKNWLKWLQRLGLVHLVPILSVALGLFLSLWIIIPAPTIFLLALSVGVSEFSPLIIGFNIFAFSIVLSQFKSNYLYTVLLSASLFAIILSSLPLIQFSTTEAKFQLEMETKLGRDYLQKIPAATIAGMRSKPLVLKDIVRGISLEKVRIERNIGFSTPDGYHLKLNLYRPLAKGKYPGVIVIYGGAWRQGDPSNYEAFSRYIAAQNYTVVALDYRHAPKYKFPTQLEDVRAAIDHISDCATAWEIDLQRVAIIGRSAGAQLASIAAYQNQSEIRFRAVVNYYGPVDLVNGYNNLPVPDPINTRPVLQDFLGGSPTAKPELYHQASPINYVKSNLPTSLLIYGGRDNIVQPQYGLALAEKLEEAQNSVVFTSIPWADHAFDTVFSGMSNQLALFYTERFLAWNLKDND